MSACLRLESFSRRPTGPAPILPEIKPADIEAAREAGFAAGRAAAEDQGRAALAEALDRLVAALSDDAERRAAEAAQWRRRTVLLVHAVIDQIAPRLQRAVLGERIMAEIDALRAAVPPPLLQVRCDADTADLLRGVLQAAGHDDVEVAVTDGCPAIAMRHGVLTLDMEGFSTGLRRLVSEFGEGTDDGQD